MPAVRLTVLGDSFVEGRGDPSTDGPYVGWVPRFAGRLGLPAREVLNLGTFEATTQDVIDRQLALALVRKAPLIGVVVGVNDLVRRYSPEGFAANLTRIFGSLTGFDTTVFTASYPDIPANLPVPEEFRALLRRRFAQANATLRQVCADTGTLCLELSPATGWSDPDLWSADGLHPNTAGHHRFAADLADLVERATGLIPVASSRDPRARSA
jgi:lysophospholipase L1-like esterase